MEYDSFTARCYAAYRPPLHGRLLGSCLPKRGGRGLDIGCGTGHSTRALRAYCDEVVGLEPSAAMLHSALPAPGVAYRLQRGERLRFPDRAFDVVTLAGSWYYAQSPDLLAEIVRVGRPGAYIVVYDFAANLQPFCAGLPGQPAGRGDYDPTLNFTHTPHPAVRLSSFRSERIPVEMDVRSLSWLICSEADRVGGLTAHFGVENLPERLAAQLADGIGDEMVTITFATYASVYRV